MPRLLILSRHADQYQRLIESAALPDLEITSSDTVDQLGEAALQSDLVFGEPDLIRGVLMIMPNLRWAQSMLAGVEQLLDPSLRRDYVLTKARGVFGELMSEYVIGYLLFHERRIARRQQAQMEHRWDSSMTGILRGKTIGLLGVGSIGAHIAATAKHFKMTVRGYTRSSEDCSDVDVYYHEGELLQFARRLDYLVSVLPNTPRTRHVVDASLLDALPPHALFINAGRGSAVDESALIYAINSRKIAGAVLDVFAQEPLPKEHPIWDTPNLLMTFHTSVPSLPEDIAKLFLENYLRFTKGAELLHRVDFERGY
jgi:phosphoglycerate dehydrogenase-like enzyme